MEYIILVAIIGAALLLTIFFSKRNNRKIYHVLEEILNRLEVIEEKQDNGVLERLYDILHEELAELDNSEYAKAMWRYFHAYKDITYNNYKMIRSKGLEIFSDDTIINLQGNHGEHQVNGLRVFFSKEFTDAVDKVNKEQLQEFFRKSQYLIASNADFSEAKELIYYTFRKNARSVVNLFMNYKASGTLVNKESESMIEKITNPININITNTNTNENN